MSEFKPMPRWEMELYDLRERLHREIDQRAEAEHRRDALRRQREKAQERTETLVAAFQKLSDAINRCRYAMVDFALASFDKTMKEIEE